MFFFLADIVCGFGVLVSVGRGLGVLCCQMLSVGSGCLCCFFDFAVRGRRWVRGASSVTCCCCLWAQGLLFARRLWARGEFSARRFRAGWFPWACVSFVRCGPVFFCATLSGSGCSKGVEDVSLDLTGQRREKMVGVLPPNMEPGKEC